MFVKRYLLSVLYVITRLIDSFSFLQHNVVNFTYPSLKICKIFKSSILEEYCIIQLSSRFLRERRLLIDFLKKTLVIRVCTIN